MRLGYKDHENMREYYKKIDGEMSERLNIMKFIFMLMVVFIHSDALPELPFEYQNML